MKDYGKWTAEQRKNSLALTNEAKRKGLIARPTRCRLCGQTEGILHHHNIDYDVTLAYIPKMLYGMASPEEVAEVNRVLVPLCWRCHIMLHKAEKHPLSWKKYRAEVESGKQYPPVYKPDDWDKLNEHLID